MNWKGEGRLTAPEAAPGDSDTGRRVARNTLLSAVGEGSNLLIFALGFLAARLLGPEAFGQYGAAFAFVGLFRILPDFGMSYASTLEISRDRSRAARLGGNLLSFQALLSLLTLASCLGLGRWLFQGPTWTAVAVLSLDLVLKSAQSTLRWLLKGFERFGAEALTLVAERALLLVLCLATLRAGYGVIVFVLKKPGDKVAVNEAILVIEALAILLLNPLLLPGAGPVAADFGAPEPVAALLFSDYLLPFEAISVLLLVAMIGAILLTRQVRRAR